MGTAAAGAEYFAIFPGPIEVDGISWTRLIALEGGFSAWAASGSGGDRYLELVPPDCPSADPDLATLVTMLEWDRLACFGNRPLTVEGTYGCPPAGGCGGTAGMTFAPGWLAGPYVTNPLWVEYPSSSVVELRIAPDSGITLPAKGSVVRVIGHFSDPASTTCTLAMFEGEQATPIDPKISELYCRERFVVDVIEVLGTDPAYP